MGSLTPGATYIYERANGIIYAREFGKTERQVIGYDLGKSAMTDFALWNDIVSKSESYPALQKALENVIMIYNLTKDDNI